MTGMMAASPKISTTLLAIIPASSNPERPRSLLLNNLITLARIEIIEFDFILLAQLRGVYSRNHTITHDKQIHVRAEVAFEGVHRGVDDGFVFVEARVEQDRDPGFLVKAADESVVARGDRLHHGLQTTAPVHVGDRGDFRMP